MLVTFNSRGVIGDTLRALVPQLGAGDELVVVDNASDDGTVALVAELAPDATVVVNERNEGFAAGCNRAVAQASGDLFVLLNPDAVPAPDFCEAIRRPLVDDRGWDAWMGLVTMDGGRAVNTSGNIVHFTGLAWAGGVGTPVEEAPAEPREVPVVSGACLAVRRETWDAIGGFPPEFFMYHEDVDLSLRIHLAGGKVGIEPAARVDHGYEFHKSSPKWRFMERNRWAVVLRLYPAPLLALVAPALLVTEVAILAASVAGGWTGQKLMATGETLRALPRLLRERRAIQRGRVVSAAEFAAWLSADLSSPYLGRAARIRPIRTLLATYWRLVLIALRRR